MAQFISAAENWLAANTSIPAGQRQALARLVADLLALLPASRPAVVAISGPPGTGKSTVANSCAAVLGDQQVSSIVIALDDYYLSAARRNKLSRSEHPLFAVRGVPGTHDFELLLEHLQSLLDPHHPDISLPKFDKSIDSRLDDARLVPAGFVPAVIFVEGWIVGVPPQTGAQVLSPANDLEAGQDSDGEWRHRVNAHLYDYYKALDPLIDTRWNFQAPGWDSVIEWRWHQEQDGQQEMLDTRDEAASFLNHFQRLCMHMQNTSDQWADVVIQLDPDHIPTIQGAI